jgi:hypothetical protein
MCPSSLARRAARATPRGPTPPKRIERKIRHAARNLLLAAANRRRRLIAAHAQTAGLALLTRDRARVAAHFPEVALIAPTATDAPPPAAAG